MVQVDMENSKIREQWECEQEGPPEEELSTLVLEEEDTIEEKVKEAHRKEDTEPAFTPYKSSASGYEHAEDAPPAYVPHSTYRSGTPEKPFSQRYPKSPLDESPQEGPRYLFHG